MPTSQDPYSTVAKQEAKQDADTGRRVKKWGHRAEGLVAGTILGAAAHKYGPGLLKRIKLEDMQHVHQFSRRDPLPDMGNEYLNQVLRHNQQDSCYTPVNYVQTEVVEDLIMRPLNETHNFDENEGITAGYQQPVPDCPDNGKIRSPEELYAKKVNAGQTKPQTPLATPGRPLAQIVRLAAQRRVTQFIAGYDSENGIEKKGIGNAVKRNAGTLIGVGADTAALIAGHRLNHSGLKVAGLGLGTLGGAAVDAQRRSIAHKKTIAALAKKPGTQMGTSTPLRHLSVREYLRQFAEDANLRAHSPSGQFANVAQDQSAQIRKAYSPHQRVTGISPFKKKIMAAGKALMR